MPSGFSSRNGLIYTIPTPLPLTIRLGIGSGKTSGQAKGELCGPSNFSARPLKCNGQ